MHIVSQDWSQYIDGSPSYVWEQKLKKTKVALKKWVKNTLNTPTNNKQEKVLELYEIQLEMEVSEIAKSQLALEQFAQIKTSQVFRQEDEYL